MNYLLLERSPGLFLTEMPRKKILWFCSWYPDKFQPFNGDFVQRHAKAAALSNDIYVIHVAADHTGGTEKTQHVISQFEGLTEHIVYFKPSGILPKLINFRRWKAAYRQAIEKYKSVNGIPHLVHVHVPARDGLMAIYFQKKYSVPFLVTEHWTIYQPQNEINYEGQSRITRSVLYWVIKNCRLLLPVSKDLGELINKLVVKKEFRVLENVADTRHFNFSDGEKEKPVFRFIHVSNGSYQKNLEGIIRIFSAFVKDHQEAELIIVGNIPKEHHDLVEETGLLNKQIYIKGEVRYEEVAGEMQASDALLMFSRFENSPCSIIEALCCGLPVVATKVGGIPELIDPSNGVLVEMGDERELLNAMRFVMENYRSFDRKKISEKAGRRFSYEIFSKNADEIYSEF